MARAHPAPFSLSHGSGPAASPSLAAHVAGPENPPTPLGLPAAAGGARPLVRVVRRRCPFDSDAARHARRQRVAAAAERAKAGAQELLERRLQRQAETERLLAASREALAAIRGGREQGAGAAARAALVAASNGGRRQGAGAAALPVPGEIYEALKAIPDLDRADLLRGYSVLVRDERRFRGLMALPKELRKDWLLMEIEGNQ